MATLKISDLSVGDWVRYDNGVTPYSIRSIVRTGDQECVVLKDNMYPDGITGFVKYLKPIPITAEVLEKNGWKKEGRSYRWSNEKYRVFIWLKKFSHFVDVVEMDKQFATKSSCIEVSQLHVHQLQHALRLAGVDKEINL